MENHIGTRVKQYREFKGMRQNAFCELAGIRQQTLSTIEAGSSEPSAGVLQKLFLAYPDLSPEWVLLGTNSMTKDGRALTPRAAEPAADYTSANSTEQTLYISVLKEQVADLKSQVTDLKEDKADLKAEVSELRGKPFDSSDAAGHFDEAPTDPQSPAFAGGAAPQPWVRVRGLVRYAEEAAGVAVGMQKAPPV